MDSSLMNSSETNDSYVSLSPPSSGLSSSNSVVFGFSETTPLAPVAIAKRNAQTRKNISLLSNALSQSSPNVFAHNVSGSRTSCESQFADMEINEPTCNSPVSPTAPIAIPTTCVSIRD